MGGFRSPFQLIGQVSGFNIVRFKAGYHDFDPAELVSPVPLWSPDALAAQAQLGAAGRTGRYGQPDRAV